MSAHEARDDPAEPPPPSAASACGSAPTAPMQAVSGGDLPAEVVAAAADPRRRVGRYVLIDELGRGGMGVVWRAYDTALRRPVAFKTFLDRPGDEELRRFSVEVKATARLQHPNIVSVLDVGEHDGRAWYVMELVDGESFEALLRRAPPTPARIAEIVRDVARALEHAHARGIVHRDVKPDNILIDREGRVRLADLGLARDGAATQQLTHTGQLLGTPAYMAPEQAGGEGAVGPSSDVYALGGVLYRALAGRPPFTAPTVFALLKRLLFDAVTPIRKLNPEAPPELERLAIRCLSKTPSRRPPSAAAIADALEQFLHARRRGGAGPPLPEGPPPAPARRVALAPPARVAVAPPPRAALVRVLPQDHPRGGSVSSRDACSTLSVLALSAALFLLPAIVATCTRTPQRDIRVAPTDLGAADFRPSSHAPPEEAPELPFPGAIRLTPVEGAPLELPPPAEHPFELSPPAEHPIEEVPAGALAPSAPGEAVSMRARWDFLGHDAWVDQVRGRRARGERVEVGPDGLVFSGPGGGLELSPDVLSDLPAGAVAMTLRRDEIEPCRVLAFVDPGVVSRLGISVDAAGRPILSVGPTLLTAEVAIERGRFHRLAFAWGPRGCKIVVDGTIVAQSADGGRVTRARCLELGRDPNNRSRTGSHMTLRSLEVHEGDLDDDALRGL